MCREKCEERSTIQCINGDFIQSIQIEFILFQHVQAKQRLHQQRTTEEIQLVQQSVQIIVNSFDLEMHSSFILVINGSGEERD